MGPFYTWPNVLQRICTSSRKAEGPGGRGKWDVVPPGLCLGPGRSQPDPRQSVRTRPCTGWEPLGCLSGAARGAPFSKGKMRMAKHNGVPWTGSGTGKRTLMGKLVKSNQLWV